jgi:hypothetical protein
MVWRRHGWRECKRFASPLRKGSGEIGFLPRARLVGGVKREPAAAPAMGVTNQQAWRLHGDSRDRRLAGCAH